DIYQGLGVTEVWQWQDGQFLIHHLRPTGYEQITHSELLPNLDRQQLASYVNPTDQFDAVMAFRDKIRSLS
ncbi:MAG: Uma2 family endonuclease, partial [Leptodesmis sp.]